MLNYSFSNQTIDECKQDLNNYILPDHLVDIVLQQNYIFNTGQELRLQDVYTFEIKYKLDSLHLSTEDFLNYKILDVCCGNGFLSYHILKLIQHKSVDLTLTDLSKNELNQAEKLLTKFYPNYHIKYFQSDILKSNFPNESFDIIIGNSFLHHFYNIPFALKEFRRLLKPGGLFITLHEPTIASVAYESGNLKLVAKYFLRGNRYIDDIRYKEKGVAPNSGADVWMFNINDIKSIFIDAGFTSLRLQTGNILRPFVVANRMMHLDKNKQQLNSLESLILEKSIIVDKMLSKVLPSRFFGSFSIVAFKDT